MKTTLPESTLARRAPLSNLTKLFAAVCIATLVLITSVVGMNPGVRFTSGGQAAHQVYLQDIEPHPFGPGWAADYGTVSDAPAVSIIPNPFGPGWAATYGLPAQ